MVEDRPLGSWMSFLKGILGGSLMGSGIFSLDFGVAAQAIVFIMGFLTALDAIISKTEEIYPMTMFLGALAGFFISLFSAVGGVSLYYTALILVLGALAYLGRFAKTRKR